MWLCSSSYAHICDGLRQNDERVYLLHHHTHPRLLEGTRLPYATLRGRAHVSASQLIRQNASQPEPGGQTVCQPVSGPPSHPVM